MKIILRTIINFFKNMFYFKYSSAWREIIFWRWIFFTSISLIILLEFVIFIIGVPIALGMFVFFEIIVEVLENFLNLTH